MTLEEWSQSTAAHRLLTENLKVNLEVMLNDPAELLITQKDEVIQSLMRLNLIMVRQFEEMVKN
jgi:hypothetical protein